ncbi:hypothetical protein FRB93_007904 [Tulasnella sp. JGI-2019a]|nr:hypothetical protein FRB93_007904 [Tulasnella sp. JGI-2019a]
MPTLTRKDRCHQGILLEEILVQIFRHASRPALAAAAVVCRAWSDLALEILWEEVDLVDFLNVFGQVTIGVWSIIFKHKDRKRAPDRLIFYGAWIKRAHLHLWTHRTIVDELQMAFQHLPGPLLPRIENLEFAHPYGPSVDGSYLSHIVPFMASTLRKLRIRSLQVKGWEALRPQLSVLSPFLEELVLGTNDWQDGSISGVAEMLAPLPALRILNLSLSTTSLEFIAILSVIATHGQLEELRLSQMESSSSCLVLTPSESFPSLRRLYLRLGHPGILLFNKYFSSLTEITEIEVLGPLDVLFWEDDIDEVEWIEDVTEFLRAVGACTRLESLTLEASFPKDNLDAMPIAVIWPLRSCPLLKSLSIKLGWPLSINDADLATLLQCLPHLVDFELEVGITSSHCSTLTLQAFVIFTTFCPMIQTICVSVDASKIPSHEVVYYPTDLKRINVQSSYIDDPMAVATFLSHLPASQDLEVRWRLEARLLESKWEEVQDILYELRDVRDGNLDPVE